MSTPSIQQVHSNLVNWINTFPNKYCALVDKVTDAYDGFCIVEIVKNIFSIHELATLKTELIEQPTDRINKAIKVVSKKMGKGVVWKELSYPDLGERIAIDKDTALLTTLLQFLQSLHTDIKADGQRHSMSSHSSIQKMDSADKKLVTRRSSKVTTTNKHRSGTSSNHSTLIEHDIKKNSRREKERSSAYNEREKPLDLNARRPFHTSTSPPPAVRQLLVKREQNQQTAAAQDSFERNSNDQNHRTNPQRTAHQHPDQHNSHHVNHTKYSHVVPKLASHILNALNPQQVEEEDEEEAPLEPLSTQFEVMRGAPTWRSSVRRHSTCQVTLPMNSDGESDFGPVRPVESGQQDSRPPPVLLPRQSFEAHSHNHGGIHLNRQNSHAHKKPILRSSQGSVSAASMHQSSEWNDPATMQHRQQLLHWLQNKNNGLNLTIQRHMVDTTADSSGSKSRKSVQSSQDFHSPTSTLTYLGRLAEGRFTSYESRVGTEKQQWQDPWYNGVLLSEIVAAVLPVGKKDFVKQITVVDIFGRPEGVPKLVLDGTQYPVKQQAQAVRNFNVCINALSTHVPHFPPLQYSSDDLVSGPSEYLWSVLTQIHTCCAKQTKQSGGSTNRGARSTSAPPAMQRDRGLAQHTRQVRFSNSTKLGDERDGRGDAHSHHHHQHSHPNNTQNTRTLSHPHQHHAMGVDTRAGDLHSTLIGQQRLQQHNQRKQHNQQYLGGDMRHHTAGQEEVRRSRSLSPTDTRRRSSSIDRAPRNHNLTSRSNDVSRSRSRSRSRSPSVRSSGSSASGSEMGTTDPHMQRIQSFAAVRESEMRMDREAVRKKELEKRMRRILLIEKRKQDTTSQPGTNNQKHGDNTKSSTSDANPDKSTHKIEVNRYVQLGLRNKKHYAGNWVPPKLSDIEVEALLSRPIPVITFAQMHVVKGWMASLGLFVQDGEGGFYTANNTNSFADSAKANPANDTPPLDIRQDRLRNGVFLCELCSLLEPHAAEHTKLAANVHVNPISLAHCAENIDKALWLFRIRRSPPLPLVYLVQTKEIISGNKSVLWGLLFEIMQAYPYILDCLNDQNEKTALPHERASLLHPPSYLFYNMSEKKTGAKVDAITRLHSLPYSAQQRRELDLSLVNWLSSCGIIQLLYGNSIPPCATVVSLEGFVKDGTLLCQLANHVFRANLTFNMHPATYQQCMSNLNQAVEFFRRCGTHMSGRYLFCGVEDKIHRGEWDCILGLLEDIHRYCDAAKVAMPAVAHLSLRQTGDVVQSVQEPYLGRGSRSAVDVAVDSRELFNKDGAFRPLLDIAHTAVDEMVQSRNNARSSNNTHSNTHSNSAHSRQSSPAAEKLGRTSPFSMVDEAFLRGEDRQDADFRSHLDLMPGIRLSGPREESLSPPVPPPPPKTSLLSNFTHQQYNVNDMTAMDPAMTYQLSATSPKEQQQSLDRVSGKDRTGIEQSNQVRWSLDIQHGNTVDTKQPKRKSDSASKKLPVVPSWVATYVSSCAQHSSSSGGRTDKDSDDSPASPGADSSDSSPSVEDIQMDSDSIEPADLEANGEEAGESEATVSPSKIAAIHQWMSSLGCKIPPSGEVDFSDGVLLLRLMLKLERLAMLPGFTPRPKTTAHKVQNIRHALELARMKKRLSELALDCEEEILRNDLPRVYQLLSDIKRAYALYKK